MALSGSYSAGQQIWSTAVASANDSTAKEELGAIRFEGGKVYQYVQDSGSGVTLGYIVTIDKNYKVTSATGLNDDTVLAGHFGIACAALTASYYGWVQLRGVATVAKTVTSDLAQTDNPLYVKSTGLVAAGTTSQGRLVNIWVATTATTAQTTVECQVALL